MLFSQTQRIPCRRAASRKILSPTSGRHPEICTGGTCGAGDKACEGLAAARLHVLDFPGFFGRELRCTGREGGARCSQRSPTAAAEGPNHGTRYGAHRPYSWVQPGCTCWGQHSCKDAVGHICPTAMTQAEEPALSCDCTTAPTHQTS